MKYINKLATLAMFLAPTAMADTPTVGSIHPPVVTNVTVHTQVSQSTGQYGQPEYLYAYIITNPATNTGYIWNIQLDVSAPNNYQFNVPGDLTVPRGGEGVVEFYQLQNETIQNDPSLHENVVPFGITAPDGWLGSLTVNQTGGFWAANGSQEIAPGQTADGFTMVGLGVPTIRTMSLIPDWIPTFGDREATVAESVQAAQIEQSLIQKVSVLGPSYTSPGTYDNWNEFAANISSAVQFGWITDVTFGNTMKADLAAARAAMDQNGLPATLAPLQKMLADIQASSATQRNGEAYALLLNNVEAIIAAIPPDEPPAPPPASPKATFVTPTTNVVTAAVGSSVTVTEQVVNQANHDAPMAGYSSPISIDGPDSDQAPASDLTDQNGQISVTITGKQIGVDHLTLPFHGTREIFGGPLETDIVWNGGPDLTVTTFSPPQILEDGTSFQITDTTKNIGNTVAAPSTTYYLLADSFPVEQSNTFYIVDWRDVPALQPGESSTSSLEVGLSSVVPPGRYYLIACANWDRAIGETDYSNNCNDGQLVGVFHTDAAPPPVCTAAAPGQKLLWPPNHQMVSVTINGVTDPNGETPTITITGIQQDEPVNAKGDGNTAPDGSGVGTSTAQVRSERSGIAVGGRLYFISFKASDSRGGSCTSTVVVGVPHDQGQHSMPTDNGLRYDSTSLH